LCKAPFLSMSDFQLVPLDGTISNGLSSLNLTEMEKEVIRKALQKYSHNLTRAAEELGIGRTTLYRKMEEYGLNVLTK